MIKYFRVALPKHIYNQFKHKCNFYEVPMQEVASELISRFLEGDFDEDFGIAIIKEEGDTGGERSIDGTSD